jgi:hypothetical protein
MFLDANLPTMLAPRNFPAFAAGIDCEYLIYTTARDALQIRQSLAFQRLCSVMSVSLELFKPSKTKHPITLHHDIWRQATEHARRRGALLLLMAPDVAWADGSFARLRAAFEAGKRLVFMTYPRVISETIVPAMAARFPRSADQSVTIPPRDMMALAITHMHPLMAGYSRSSAHFPIHPEMILWPIEGDGFLLRLLARELFCFEPGRYPLNSQALLARLPPSEEIEVLRDSSEFLGVSFAPLWKGAEWYLRRGHLDPLFTGRWWIHYDSPINDYISAFDLRFACGSADEARWRRAELAARSLLTHLRAAREFMRVLHKLRQMGHWHAAAFLALALSQYGLARRWPHRGRFLVLAPTDKAMERAGFRPVPGHAMTAAEARQTIEAHVAALPECRVIQDGATLTTLAGWRIRVENTALAQHCGDSLVLPTKTLLCPRPPSRLGRHTKPTALPTA